MPRLHLTDVSIRALKAPENGQVTYWDKGLGVRVSWGGTKTFIVLAGIGRRKAIGRYPDLSLAEARKKAKKVIAQPRLSELTFHDALDLYVSAHLQKYTRPKTAKETERLLRKHFSTLGPRHLEDINPSAVSSCIDELSPPSIADHAFVALGGLFRWAERRGYMLKSPCANLRPPAKSSPRTRVLSDDELKRVWEAATKSGMFGIIVKVLILTGQRRGEIAALRPEFFTDRICTLPGRLTKNRREHSFPVGALCATVLASCQGREPAALLFPARGEPERAFKGWSKSKRKLDQLSGVHDWTLHDLRRTFATNLAALAVPPHITERLLNHATGTISGVAAIYNRHAYVDEMRAAIALWEERLSSLLAPPGLADLPTVDAP